MSAENGAIRILGNIKQRVTSLTLEQCTYAVGMAAYLGLNAVDILTTSSGLEVGRYEMNPLANFFMERYDPTTAASLLMYKMIGVPPIIGMVELIRRRSGYRNSLYALGALNVPIGIAVLNNSNIISIPLP